MVSMDLLDRIMNLNKQINKQSPLEGHWISREQIGLNSHEILLTGHALRNKQTINMLNPIYLSKGMKYH